MKLDEFNNVKVTNESSTFKKEFGGTPSDEFRFFNDNVTNIKSEINVDKTSNDDLRPVENEEKAESRPQEEKLKNEDLKRNMENSSDGSSQSSSSSSSSSTSTGTVSQASSTATSIASTSASVAATASVAAIATVSAVAGINVITNTNAKADITSFLMFNNRIEYQLNLSGIEDGENCTILVEGTNYSKTNTLKAGLNKGSFDGLTENGKYNLTVYEDKLLGSKIHEQTFTYVSQLNFKGLIFDKNYDSRDNSFNVQFEYSDEINALSDFTFELQKLSEGEVVSSQTFELEKTLASQKLVAVNMDLSGDFKYTLSYKVFKESKSIVSEVFNFVDIAPQVITGSIKSIAFSDKLGEDNASFAVSLEFEGETSVISDISLTLSTQESSTFVALENKGEQTATVSSQELALEPDVEYSYSLSYKVNGNDAEPLLGKVSFEPEEVIPTAEVTSFEAVANAEFAKSTFSISVSFDGEVELKSLDIYPQEYPNDIRELSVLTQKGEQTIDYSGADLMLEQDTTYCLVLHYLSDGEEKEISTVAKFVDISKYATFNSLIFDKTANFKDGSFSVQLDYEESEPGLFSDFQLILTDVVNNISHTYDLETTKDVQTLQLFTRAAGASFDPSSTFTYQLSYKNQGELVEEATSEQFTFTDSYVSSARITNIALVDESVDFLTGEALIKLTYEDEDDEISNIVLYVIETSTQKEAVFELVKTPEDQLVTFGELTDGNLSYTLSYDVNGKASEEPLQGEFSLSAKLAITQVIFDGNVNFETRETSVTLNFTGDTSLLDEERVNFILQDMDNQDNIYSIPVALTQDTQAITLPEELDLDARYFYCASAYYKDSEEFIDSEVNEITLTNTQTGTFEGFEVNNEVNFDERIISVLLNYEEVKPGTFTNFVLHLLNEDEQEVTSITLFETNEAQSQSVDDPDFVFDEETPYYCKLTYDENGVAQEFMLPDMITFVNTNVDQDPRITSVSFTGEVDFTTGEAFVSLDSNAAFETFTNVEFVLTDINNNVDYKFTLTDLKSTINLNNTDNQIDYQSIFKYHVSYIVDEEQFSTEEQGPIELTNSTQAANSFNGADFITDVNFSTYEIKVKLDYTLDSASSISNIVLTLKDNSSEAELVKDLQPINGEYQTVSFADAAFELSENTSYQYSFTYYINDELQPTFTGDNSLVFTNTETSGDENIINTVAFDGNVNFKTRDAYVTIGYVGDLESFSNVYFVLQDIQDETKTYSIHIPNVSLDTQTITLPEELDLTAMYNYYVTYNVTDKQETLTSSVYQVEITNTYESESNVTSIDFAEQEIDFSAGEIYVTLNYLDNTDDLSDFVLTLHETSTGKSKECPLTKTDVSQPITFEDIVDGDFTYELTWKVVGETCKNPISGSVHFNEHQQASQASFNGLTSDYVVSEQGIMTVTLQFTDPEQEYRDIYMVITEIGGEERSEEFSLTKDSDVAQEVSVGNSIFAAESFSGTYSISVRIVKTDETETTIDIVSGQTIDYQAPIFGMVIQNYNLSENEYILSYQLNQGDMSKDVENIQIVLSTQAGYEYVYTHQEPEATTGYSTINIVRYLDESTGSATSGEALLEEFAGGVQVIIRYELDGETVSEVAYSEASFE